MRLGQIVVISLLPALGACAKRPDAIVPVSIPIEAYTSLSCSQIQTKLSEERARLSGLNAAQDSAATGDALGVFFIGVPASSAFGANKEGEVAASKGKVQAMELALQAKRCPGT